MAHAAEEKRNFTLVIDAGHGGHDAGAVGAYSKEKTINLNVALAFGRLVEENCPDVKVIYTRRTDVFIPLQQRADIANNNKADLFISVHTNALPNGRIAYGSETYSLGMARAGANLAVAKRENSVITLESDYKRTYQGFDPNKAESYVIFEIMQDKYMKQSVDLASCIQRQYTAAGRPNKGVHQAGFLVLRNTSMPSVLTELGFITTPAEEAYLNSQQGIAELSRSIYNGFLSYRRMHEKAAHDIPANLPFTTHTSPTQQTASTLSQGAASAQQPLPSTAPVPASSSDEVAVVPVAVVPTSQIAKASNKSKQEDKADKQQTAPVATPKATPKVSEKPKTAEKPATQTKDRATEKPATKAVEKSATKPSERKDSRASNKDKATAEKSQTTTSEKGKSTANKNKTTADKSKTTADKDKAPIGKKKAETDNKKAEANSKKTPTSKDKISTNKDKAPASKDKTSASKDKTTDNKSKATDNKKKGDNASSKKSSVTYRIQVGAGKTEIATTDAQFKGLNVTRVKEGSMYKYFHGSYSSYAEAQKALRTAKAKLSSAYIVAYVNGKSTSVAEARAKEQGNKK